MPQAEQRSRFWQFRNQTENPDSAELILYGDISRETWYGDEITPQRFAEDLAAIGAVSTIYVHILSPGGDIFAAQGIGNQLERHPARTIAMNDGLCGSAAMTIACHCDEFQCAEDSEIMVHLPTVGACGYLDEVELGRLQDALKTIKENIVSLYCRKTGKSVEDVTAMVNATKWMTGKQAVEAGFADKVIENAKPTKIENRNGYLFVNALNTQLPFKSVPQFVQDSASRFVDNAPDNKPEKKSHKEENEMAETINTVSDLAAAYPTLVNQIQEQAANNALSAERQRIQDIQDMTMPGMENIARDAMFGEKPLSAVDFAKEVAKAAQQSRVSHLNAMQKDANKSGAESVTNQAGANGEHEDEYLNALRGLAAKATK